MLEIKTYNEMLKQEHVNDPDSNFLHLEAVNQNSECYSCLIKAKFKECLFILPLKGNRLFHDKFSYLARVCSEECANIWIFKNMDMFK